MSSFSELECRHCRTPALLIDTYCEVCGARLRPPTPHDAADRHEVRAQGVAGASDRGRVRAHNEDTVGVGNQAGCAYAIVCDGVASSEGGRFAAEAARDAAGTVLATALRTRDDGAWDAREVMHTAIAAAQVAVLAATPLPAGADDGPSCTFVAGVWDGEEVTVGSVGDSRAYWVGRTTSVRLTVDDSWAQEQVDAGTMTESAAMSAPDAHVITRWLGPDAPQGPYRVHTFRPREPGRLILCSDGLWQYASSPAELRELVELLLPADDPAALARDLVRAACGLGGGDNVTVAIVEVDPDRVRQEETA